MYPYPIGPFDPPLPQGYPIHPSYQTRGYEGISYYPSPYHQYRQPYKVRPNIRGLSKSQWQGYAQAWIAGAR